VNPLMEKFKNDPDTRYSVNRSVIVRVPAAESYVKVEAESSQPSVQIKAGEVRLTLVDIVRTRYPPSGIGLVV
jgi:hypothetical protein